jgi:hypothetical protein
MPSPISSQTAQDSPSARTCSSTVADSGGPSEGLKMQVSTTSQRDAFRTPWAAVAPHGLRAAHPGAEP